MPFLFHKFLVLSKITFIIKIVQPYAISLWAKQSWVDSVSLCKTFISPHKLTATFYYHITSVRLLAFVERIYKFPYQIRLHLQRLPQLRCIWQLDQYPVVLLLFWTVSSTIKKIMNRQKTTVLTLILLIFSLKPFKENYNEEQSFLIV